MLKFICFVEDEVITMLDQRILDTLERIEALQTILDFSIEDMAKATDVSVDEYNEIIKGKRDLSFTFVYKCANVLRVDITDLLTGESPHLSSYTVVKNGEGLELKRREGFKYQNLAYQFKNKTVEPFKVLAKFEESQQDAPITLSTHEGEEFDYVLSGSLKIVVDGHTEILKAGDAIYYDSSKAHGMIAVNGKPCEFLAIVTDKGKID